MDEKDEDIILEMCEGDVIASTAALERLLKEHGLPLLRRIKQTLNRHGITHNVDDMAEDILQDLASKLWQAAKEGKLLEVKSLTRYVFGSARLRTLCYLRDEANRPENTHPLEEFWEKTDRILVEEGVMPTEMAELEEALYACINELPGLQQKYISIRVAHYENPPEPSEIADMCGVSPESVRNRLHEARQKLLECLNKKEIEIPNPLQGGTR